MYCYFSSTEVNNMKSKNILADSKLLFLFGRISGFISFRTDGAKNGETHIIFENCHYIFFLFFQTIIQIRMLFLFCDFCKWSYKLYANNFLYILSVISEFSYMVFSLAICICSKVYAKENQQFWQALYKVEKELQQLQIKLNHTYLQRVTHACVYIAIGTSVVLTTCFVMLDEKKVESDTIYYIIVRFSNYYKATTSIFLNCQLIVSLNTIKEIFLKLEEAVNEKVLDGRYLDRKYLLDIAKCHQKVCEITKQCNDVMSIPLVFEFVQLFCFLTANAFSCAIVLITNEYVMRDVMRLIWIAIFLVAVITLVVVSHKCMKKVSL